MKSILIGICFTTIFIVVQGRPEPPVRFRVTSQKQQQQSPEYLPPPPPDSYGAPPPSKGYGVPPTDNYGAPLPRKQTLITKNVYVHLPPPEYPEIETAPKEIEQVRKHYKIVFIKTPNAPTPKPVKLPAQDEHKTLVYVLVKKPETERPIETPATTEATKPEVFFIKYKENSPSNSYGPPNK
uniref:CSON012215 protein n=1 Tax=Culicoides sonorensis TaxID=179676 RepID=A0A336M4X9_CULSO